MPRVTYSVEQITHKLREAEVLLAQGQTVKELCRQWSITEPTIGVVWSIIPRLLLHTTPKLVMDNGKYLPDWKREQPM